MEAKFQLDQENENNEYSLEGIAGMVRITPGKEAQPESSETVDQFYSLPM